MSLVQLEYPSPNLALLKLNRPEKLNALSAELVSELTAKIKDLSRRADQFEIRALILASSSVKAFCAGADLMERAKMDENQVAQTLDALRVLMDAVASVSCPTMAVMEGIAFGGGLELALACDFRFAHPQAKMGLTEVKLAIIPGAGGTQRLSRIVGQSRAKELIFMAKILTGAEAEAIGLVNESLENPLSLALTWAQTFELMGPLALSAAKRAIEGGLELPLKEALDWERSCYEKTLCSKDRVEGLRAFIEKRPAKYLAQ